MQVLVKKRRARRNELRCAVCHDALETCLDYPCRCGVQLHFECRLFVGRCPTLGCSLPARRPTPTALPLVQPARARRRLSALLPRFPTVVTVAVWTLMPLLFVGNVVLALALAFGQVIPDREDAIRRAEEGLRRYQSCRIRR